MGYSHRKQWTDQEIVYHIKEVMKTLDIKRMPSQSEIRNVMKSSALTNKICRTGGYKHWANRLGLELKQSETKTGNIWEFRIKEILENKGYIVEKMPTKHPYDLLINGNLKIDVKVSNLTSYKYYTFNLEKKQHNCDIFICAAIQEETIQKLMIIPSKFLMNKKQLSIGEETSRYNDFIDRYDYIEKYIQFYEEL